MTEKPKVKVVSSELDDAWVVYIDTDPQKDGEPELRIYLNDACIFENPKFPGWRKGET